MKKANRDEGQNISALHPYLKCFFDKSLILYTYENPCELASSVDYPRSRIPQIFPSNKALKNFCRKKVKKRTVFLSKTVLLVRWDTSNHTIRRFSPPNGGGCKVGASSVMQTISRPSFLPNTSNWTLWY